MEIYPYEIYVYKKAIEKEKMWKTRRWSNIACSLGLVVSALFCQWLGYDLGEPFFILLGVAGYLFVQAVWYWQGSRYAEVLGILQRMIDSDPEMLKAVLAHEENNAKMRKGEVEAGDF